MSFGKRLAEERRRLGLKQTAFAALVGTDVPRQSLYENNHRELRAAYLARLAAAEVDVLYILTGRRGGGRQLGPRASELLGCYVMLPPELQQTMDELARALRRAFGRPAGAALPSDDRSER